MNRFSIGNSFPAGPFGRIRRGPVAVPATPEATAEAARFGLAALTYNQIQERIRMLESSYMFGDALELKHIAAASGKLGQAAMDREATRKAAKTEQDAEFAGYRTAFIRGLNPPTPDPMSRDDILLDWIVPFNVTKFPIINGIPPGWPQKSNDCWLDSLLYAFYASTGLREHFINTLSIMSSSTDPNLQKLSKFIFNYLFGIIDRGWSSDQGTTLINHKAELKKRIWRNIKEYVLNQVPAPNGVCMDYVETIDVLVQYFTPNPTLSSNVGSANVIVLLSLFSCVDKQNITISPEDFNKACQGYVGVPRKPILGYVSDKITGQTIGARNSVLIIPLLGIDGTACQDTTTLTDLDSLPHVNGMSIQSIISGVNKVGMYGEYQHYVCFSKIGTDWVYYDNEEGMPQVLGGAELNKSVFIGSDELVFIFTRDLRMPGGKRGTKKQRRRQRQKSQKLRRKRR